MSLEEENKRLHNENAQLRALLLDKFLPLDWQEQFNKLVAEGKAYNTTRDDTKKRKQHERSRDASGV